MVADMPPCVNKQGECLDVVWERTEQADDREWQIASVMLTSFDLELKTHLSPQLK